MCGKQQPAQSALAVELLSMKRAAARGTFRQVLRRAICRIRCISRQPSSGTLPTAAAAAAAVGANPIQPWRVAWTCKPPCTVACMRAGRGPPSTTTPKPIAASLQPLRATTNSSALAITAANMEDCDKCVSVHSPDGQHQPLGHTEVPQSSPMAAAAATSCAPGPSSALQALLHVPFQGNLSRMDRVPSAVELRDLLVRAMDAAAECRRLNPKIDNMERVLRRIRGDLAFVNRCIALQEAACAAMGGRFDGATAAAAATVVSGDVEPALDVAPAAAVEGAGLGVQAATTPAAMTAVAGQVVHAADAAQPQQPQQSLQAAGPALDSARIQGIVNNLRGFQGELQAACYAPGVIGLLKRFYFLPQQPQTCTPEAAAADGFGSSNSSGGGCKQGGKRKGGVKRLGPGDETEIEGAVVPDGQVTVTCSSVEVDVVAQDGCAWIEVKSHERFGLDSVHWTGQPNVKGLCRQVQDLLACAQADCNHRRWRPPTVVIFFPSRGPGPSSADTQGHPTPTPNSSAPPSGTEASHVDPDVVSALQALGAHVVTHAEGLRHLPPPPPLPVATNLDVTTMCALVSEACHASVHDPALESWSLRNVHWRGCWQAEKEQGRVLQELAPWVAEERQLLAAAAAVQQFELLLSQFGGPRERERWQRLQQRLTIVGGPGTTAAATVPETAFGGPSANGSAGVDIQAAGQGGTAAQVDKTMTPRVAALDKVTSMQRAVFGVGDAMEALTLTANGNSVRSAERQGVYIEAVTHRAAWLAGF